MDAFRELFLQHSSDGEMLTGEEEWKGNLTLRVIPTPLETPFKL